MEPAQGVSAAGGAGRQSMSAAKVDLGRHLFYDLRLSGNGAQSCATCHQQDKAFTDGMATSVGSTGEDHPRNSMSLVNVAYATTLTWANPSLSRLEDQALVPMFGRHPVELGLGDDRVWLGVLERDSRYTTLFSRAFPGETDPFSRQNVVRAIAAFERTIVSARSAYDRYHFDRDEQALSASAKRGEVLFHSQPMSCFTCHGSVTFTGEIAALDRRRARSRSSTTRASTICRACCRIRPATPASTKRHAIRRTSASSRRPRCATWPSRHPTCTMAASLRSTRCWRTTRQEAERSPRDPTEALVTTIPTRARESAVFR